MSEKVYSDSDSEYDSEQEEIVHKQDLKKMRADLNANELAYNTFYVFKDFNALRPALLWNCGLHEFTELVRNVQLNESIDVSCGKNPDVVYDFLVDYRTDIYYNHDLFEKSVGSVSFDKFVAFCVKYSDTSLF